MVSTGGMGRAKALILLTLDNEVSCLQRALRGPPSRGHSRVGALRAIRRTARRLIDFAKRALRNIGSGRPSVRLDVGRPDHLAPLLGILDDVIAEFGGRACKRLEPQVGKARFRPLICES